MNEDNPLRERERETTSTPRGEVSRNLVQRIRTTKVVYPQVYSYRLTDDSHYGAQKIGYTERRDVDERIYEQTHTAAISIDYQKLWSAPAFDTNQHSFTDKDFHRYLDKVGIERRPEFGTEWFYFDGTPERSKQLFDQFRTGGYASLQSNQTKTPYTLRPEQEEAVTAAYNYFLSHSDSDDTDEKPQFLWNAKPRFGKTLATYDLAKRLNARKVLIVTNRPAIANSWYDDFAKFIDGYYFISTANSLKDKPTLTREQYNAIADGNKSQITFLSLQDLKGSRYFGGNYNKLDWVASLDWDLLVVDECHEGVDTDRTDAALDIVKRKYTLQLSGTPFKQLASAKFAQDAIYNWTYLDEQKAKQVELTNGDENGSHVNLPDLHLYTYRISEMTASTVNAGIDIDDNTYDYAFDLNEFFATDSQNRFVHENDVRAFLRNLTTNEKYPFSTPELRNELKHTFWYVGNRVNSVKALAQLLKQDPVFENYEIIIAAGDGKSFEEEAEDVAGNEKSFDRVRKAIANHDKTITLSCGQLTTGVTIKEWSAVLMLTDISSPALYMQAAFRAQNPYSWTEIVNGQTIVHRKKSAYLFDFSPTRVLRIYDCFANALSPVAAVGQITESQRRDNIRELLNFFPVISEDRDGRMVELDASQVLTFPNALAATEVVKARFMSNLLFNDSIKNVFSLPRQAEEILNKMDVETNKRVVDSKTDLDLDHGRELQANTTKRIDQNQGLILGQKIYANNIDRAVDQFTESVATEPDQASERLINEIAHQTEPVIAKVKETYHQTEGEMDDLYREIRQKQKLIVDEYVSKDIAERDPNQLKQALIRSIETDLVHHEVEKQEQKVIETERKSKEEQVKEHLRAFTRTIPMCIMANHTGREITIDNFDEVITDEDFQDLTNITKDEFAQLRDGFDYDDDNGVRRHFDGVFDKYCFNAAIAEFVEKKNQLGKYWLGDQHDIFEWIPNQKNNQIFTPKRIVAMMVDDLQKECPNLFDSTSSRFIDLYMKSGLYVTEIAKRLFKNTRHFYNSDDECIKHILENQVYGLAPTNILYNITLSTIFSGTDGLNIKTNNIKQYDLLTDAKNGTARQAVMTLFNNSGDPMFKFDAVVGNPPYQNGNDQLYAYFVDQSVKIADLVSLIFPTGWQKPTNANGLSILNNESFKRSGHFVKIDNYAEDNTSTIKLFNGVSTGGVNIMLWDKSHTETDGAIPMYEYGEYIKKRILPISRDDIPKPDPIMSSYRKVKNYYGRSYPTIADIGSARKPYGFEADPISAPQKYGITPTKEKQEDNDLRLFGLLNRKRTSVFIRRGQVLKASPLTDTYKVFIPKAWGNMDEKAGYLGGSYGEIFVGEPGDICSETYIEFGPFNSLIEARNAERYFKTKFFRAIFYVNKISQNTARETFNKVPLQDFTANSDIDWTKSIPEIDQQLYHKYGLADEEINFIETHVKPMD